MLTGFLTPDGGTVRVEGTDVATFSRKELLALPGRVHLIPQDLDAILPPRAKVGKVVEEPLDWVKTAADHRRPLVRGRPGRGGAPGRRRGRPPRSRPCPPPSGPGWPWPGPSSCGPGWSWPTS